MTTVAAMVSTKIEQARSNEEVIRYQQNLEQLVDEQTRELEEANIVLKAQNKEKEILIKEIHHRVKNNMQIMISLLNLQMNSSVYEREKKVLSEFQNRIRTMAIIHERLYLEEDISSISIDEYIDELSNSLLSSYQYSDNISVSTNINHFQLDIDASIPIGLVINELMTNSLKHAFKEKKKGNIFIEIQIEDEIVYFNYSDDGVGFDFDNRKENTFGLELIEILAGQLNAQLDFKSNNGVQVKIKFDLSILP